MRYYPIFVDLRDKQAVVIGGGAVAQRKVGVLLDAGARVRVIAPAVTSRLQEQAGGGEIEVLHRPYADGDLEGAFIAFASTDNHAVNLAVFEEATRRDQLCNVVDVPPLCNFIVPSIVDHGDLTVAISTSGNSPALAKKLKQEVGTCVGPEWGALNDILGRLRPEMKRRYPEEAPRNDVLARMLEAGIMDLIREGRIREAEELAWQCL